MSFQLKPGLSCNSLEQRQGYSIASVSFHPKQRLTNANLSVTTKTTGESGHFGARFWGEHGRRKLRSSNGTKATLSTSAYQIGSIIIINQTKMRSTFVLEWN